MNTAQPMYEWNTLPWKAFERQVFKLQKRIYQASRRDDVKTIHHLQRLLMKSWAARCLAVRRVTQDNRGKRTAGVDGVKALTPHQRMQLATSLRLPQKAKLLRRVWIDKPGATEKRPLGIPVMQDRAEQALAKLALEPEWEAKFEPNSYGFRPGRSCHDAIQAIFTALRLNPKYVLDADIAKCFDRINHQALLNKLHTFPILRHAIKAWLRAGVLDGEELFPTIEGTPQGGVISPLLANIALHGLETFIRDSFPGTYQKQTYWKPYVFRYADDFVVLHRDLAVIEEVKQMVNAWLADMGLELKPSKTRMTHTLQLHEGNVGFDFLGFHVRQYPAGKTHSARMPHRGQKSSVLGFNTIITPSPESQRRHQQALREVIHVYKMAPQFALITRLNPLIQGWSNYFSTVCSKDTLAKMDHLLYLKLRRWARFRHAHKPQRWIVKRYWHTREGQHWNFATKQGAALLKHAATAIERHVKVKGAKSPFDGDWVYWASRLGHHPELPRRIASLLRKQRGKCTWCGLFFRDGDLPELDHILPAALGGKDVYENWQLLHRHCHDAKTTQDGSGPVRGAQDKSHAVEEPDEAKVSRPVLKTSRPGDRSA